MTPARTRSTSGTSTRTALCLLTLLAVPPTAHAYIDPGTGSLLFQSLLAVLFGIGVAFRKLRTWLTRFWAFVLRRPPTDDSGE